MHLCGGNCLIYASLVVSYIIFLAQALESKRPESNDGSLCLLVVWPYESTHTVKWIVFAQTYNRYKKTFQGCWKDYKWYI